MEKKSQNSKKNMIKNKILFLSLLVVLLLVSNVRADLDDDLFAYWDVDEGTGTLLHERTHVVGSQNGTLTGTYSWETGKLSNSLQFTKSITSYVDDMGDYTPYTMRSFSVWVYPISVLNCSNTYINTVCNLYNDDNYALKIGGDMTGSCTNEVLAWIDSTSRTCYENSSFNFEKNTWYHIVGVFNSTNSAYELFINENPLVTAKVGSTSPRIPEDVILADRRYEDGLESFGGRIDELGFWNQSLDSTEISQLYNSGNGLDWELFGADLTSPTITLNTPLNNTHVNIPVNLTVSISDDSGVENATLFILNATSKAIVFQDTQTFIGTPLSVDYGYTYNFTDADTYLWYYQSSDSENNLGSSTENRTIIYHDISPLITFYNPLPFSSPLVSNPSFDLQAIVEDAFLDAVNITIYNENGTETYNNYTENLIDTLLTINETITLSEGLNTIDISARDSLESSPIIRDITRTTKTFPTTEDEVFDISINDATIRRTTYIVNNGGNKVRRQEYNLDIKDNWDSEGKHIKTDIISNKLQNSQWSIRVDFECVKGCSYMELLTDRGVDRVVDNERNLYFRYDDAIREGWDIKYLEDKGKISVVISYPNQEFFNSVGLTQTIDPIIAGLNTMTWLENVTLDTTNPIVNIVYPENDSYSSLVTSLTYTYEELNPDSCWYSEDFGVTNSSLVSCGTNFTITTIEGDNILTIYMNDSVNHVSSDVVYFNIDLPEELPSTPDSSLYDIMNIFGIGLYLFLETVETALPLLLIGLAIVGVILAIGYAIARVFKFVKVN